MALSAFVVLGFLIQAGPIQEPKPDALAPDSVKAKYYIEATKKSFSNPHQADSLARLAYQHALKTPNLNDRAQGAFLLSYIHITDNITVGEAWADTALMYFEKAKNYRWAGYVKRQLGVRNLDINRTDKGLRDFQNAIQYFEKANDSSMIAQTYGSLSLAYHDLGDYQTGLKYGHKALAMAEGRNLTIKQKNFINNAIAINHDDNKNYDSALYYHFLNLKNKESTDDDLSATYNNIGNTMQKKGSNNVAEGYFIKSLEYARKSLHTDYHLATVFNNLSKVNSELGKLSLARQYMDSAIFYSHKSESMEKLRDTYYEAYLQSVKVRDFEKATHYLNHYTEIKDSILNVEKAKVIYDLETRYETEKKEQQISLLEYQTRVKDLQLSQARTVGVLILIALILSGGVVFWFYKRSQFRQKLILSQEREQMQTQRFKAVLEGEENERTRVAKDLHDGIGQLLSTAKLSISAVELAQHDDNAKLLSNSMQVLDQAVNEVRTISHNMMPVSLTNLGLVPALKNLIGEINEANRLDVKLKTEGLDERLPPSTEVTVYRIIQEIVNNMMKHAKASVILISLVRTSDHVKLDISDDGIGFDKELITTSKGLGWKSILSRIAMLQGEIQINAQPGMGTSISVLLQAQ